MPGARICMCERLQVLALFTIQMCNKLKFYQQDI